MMTTNLQIMGNVTILFFSVGGVLAYSRFRDWYDARRYDQIMKVS